MMKQARPALNLLERKAAREIISADPRWTEYRKARGINSAMLSGAVLWDAADALGIDLATAIKKTPVVATAAKLFGGEGSTSLAAPVDWSRIRAVAREEIERRLEPVEVVRQIIIQDGRKIEATGADIRHPMFDALLASCCIRDFSGNRLNVYLYGPTGTGKTYAAAQVAKALGLPFFFHSTAQEAYDLIDYEKVSGSLNEPDFIRAFENGGVCLLDEMDRYDPKALTVVNAALANGRLVKPNGQQVERHKDFICIGAGNTNGSGATADFTAAETLDKSTLSRFAVKLAWNVSPELEAMAAEHRAANGPLALLWLQEVRAARAALERLGLPAVADQRCVEAGANMLAAGMSLDVVRDATYLAGWDADQRAGIVSLCQADMIKPGAIERARNAGKDVA